MFARTSISSLFIYLAFHKRLFIKKQSMSGQKRESYYQPLLDEKDNIEKTVEITGN